MPVKIAGIDASSSSTGFTVINDGRLVESCIWIPRNKKDPAPDRLAQFDLWLRKKLSGHNIRAVVVSSTSFNRNINTTRVISHYEGAAMVASRRYTPNVVQMKDSTARKLVLSKGNISKEKAYDEVVALVPEFDWLPFKKGGDDQVDSWTFAQAGYKTYVSS